MNRLLYLAGAAIVAMAFSACDDDTLTVGNSLTNEDDKLDITAAIYQATTRTVMADSVLSLSKSCYFGRVMDPETGSEVTSEFSTQLHLMETMYISPEADIAGRYDGRAAADSCDLVLYLSSPFLSTDSLTAMKMNVWELASPMEEGQRYYSNFNLFSNDMIRTEGLRKSKMFSFTDNTVSSTERNSSSYLDNIRITLNQPYTASDGTVYNNYGTYIMRQYYDHPEYFKNSYSFAHNVCPGFYFQITDGLGFHAMVATLGLRTYYRIQGDTAVNNAVLTLAGTREVLQTTHVTNDAKAISNLAQQDDCTYLKSPAGLFTEVTLPIDEIKQNNKSDSLIGAKIVFQRLNYQSNDERMFSTPSTVLMIPKDSLYAYFESSNVPDNKTSYYTVYSSTNNTYTFGNISNLVTELWSMKESGMSADANWKAKHPNWNKVLLIPVTYTTSSTSTSPTSIEHNMGLTSTRLVVNLVRIVLANTSDNEARHRTSHRQTTNSPKDITSNCQRPESSIIRSRRIRGKKIPPETPPNGSTKR